MEYPNHLEYYKECLETGLIRGENLSYWKMDPYYNGLCFDPSINKKFLHLFTPTKEDCKTYNIEDDLYWASDKVGSAFQDRDFGPTRQNIVLLIAAMREEL